MPQDTRLPLRALPPTSASVGTTSSIAVPSNPARRGLVVVNTSNNTISLAFDTSFSAQDAVLNSGITLMPNGGAYTMSENDFTYEAMRAIASGVSSNLAIQEYV